MNERENNNVQYKIVKHVYYNASLEACRDQWEVHTYRRHWFFWKKWKAIRAFDGEIIRSPVYFDSCKACEEYIEKRLPADGIFSVREPIKPNRTITTVVKEY